jgi:hypothetical protein
MKWVWIIIACVLVATVAVFVLPWFIPNAAYVDGHFDVPITVMRNGKPLPPDDISHVFYMECFPGSDLGELVWSETGPGADLVSSLREAPREKGVYVASVPWSTRESFLGREFNYVQPTAVYVQVELKDGRRIRLLSPLAYKDRRPEIRIDVNEGGAAEGQHP